MTAITIDRNLLEQALDALECCYSEKYDGAKIHGAKTALRAALAAQPERKPQATGYVYSLPQPHTEAEVIELDRLAAFIHTASCKEEVVMAMTEHGEAVRRILGVPKP